MPDLTPKADSTLDFFKTYSKDGSTPRSSKIVDDTMLNEKMKSSTPKNTRTNSSTPSARNLTLPPLEAPSPTSNLRKRKPTGSDKFEQPQIKPAPIKTPSVVQKIEKTPKQNPVREIEANEFTSDREANKMSMLRVLNKLLRHDIISDIDLAEFAQPDIEILRSIVKRKYKVNIAQKDADDRKILSDLLNQLDDKQKAVKRSEENNKLAFKRAIKFLINQYKKTHSTEVKDLKKKEYETLICKEYFSGILLPEVKKRKIA